MVPEAMQVATPHHASSKHVAGVGQVPDTRSANDLRALESCKVLDKAGGPDVVRLSSRRECGVRRQQIPASVAILFFGWPGGESRTGCRRA